MYFCLFLSIKGTFSLTKCLNLTQVPTDNAAITHNFQKPDYIYVVTGSKYTKLNCAQCWTSTRCLQKKILGHSCPLSPDFLMINSCLIHAIIKYDLSHYQPLLQAKFRPSSA